MLKDHRHILTSRSAPKSADSNGDGHDDADRDHAEKAEQNPVPEAGVLLPVRCILTDRGDNQVREVPPRGSSLVAKRPSPAASRGCSNPVGVAPESSAVGHRAQGTTSALRSTLIGITYAAYRMQRSRIERP